MTTDRVVAMTGRLMLGAVVPVALVLAYRARAASGDPFFPPIGTVLAQFHDLWLFAHFTSDVLPSLRVLAVGYVIAVAVGLAVGIPLGRTPWARMMVVPLINFGRSVPPIMLIPPLVLVFGIGDGGRLFVTAFASFFPVAITTIDGLRRTDPALVDMARSVRLSRLQALRRVYLPSAGPAIFGGAQTALQVALILMVSSEMIASTRGIGYLTMRAQQSFDSASVWAGIILLALLGFLINQCFAWLRDRALAWHVNMQAQAKAR